MRRGLRTSLMSIAITDRLSEVAQPDGRIGSPWPAEGRSFRTDPGGVLTEAPESQTPETQRYPHVFEPLKLGPVEVPNRIYMSPHGIQLETPIPEHNAHGQ